jgi:hypothetical protein
MNRPITLRSLALAAAILLAPRAGAQAPAPAEAPPAPPPAPVQSLRVEITSAAAVPREAVQQAAKALTAPGEKLEIRLRAEQQSGGPIRTVLELQGRLAEGADVAAALRQAVPALASATIKVGPPQSKDKESASDVAQRLAARTDLSRDEVTRQIRAAVQKEHPGVTVKVVFEGEGDQRRVRVEMEQPPAPTAKK